MGTKKELGREHALQATKRTAKQGAPATSAVPPERDEALTSRSSVNPVALSRMREDFDRMVEAMQQPRALAVMKELMTISSETLRASLRSAHTATPGPDEPTARAARR